MSNKRHEPVVRFSSSGDLWNRGSALRFGESTEEIRYRPKSMPPEATQQALQDKIKAILQGAGIPGDPQFSRWHGHAVVVFVPKDTPGAVDAAVKKNRKYVGPYPDLQGRLDQEKTIHWDKQKKRLYYQEKRTPDSPKVPVLFATDDERNRAQFIRYRTQIPPEEQRLLVQDLQRVLNQHKIPGSVQYTLLFPKGLTVFYDPTIPETKIIEALGRIPEITHDPAPSPTGSGFLLYLKEFPIRVLANAPLDLIRPVQGN